MSYLNSRFFRMIVGYGFLLLSLQSALAEELAIIVNLHNSNIELSADLVRKYYLNEQLWSTGDKIQRFYQGANSNLRQAMCSQVLQLSCSELERHFKEVGYQKALSPEKFGDSPEAVINFVKTFKGGIGFVDKNLVMDKKVKEGVKVVFTMAY